MSSVFTNPSLLSTERLKEELKSHGVPLPVGRPTKPTLLKLYETTVAKKKKLHSPTVFSSDEEDNESFMRSKVCMLEA